MTREMIQLSPRGKVIYQFLSLTVLLLPLYGLGFLLSALITLPEPPLADVISAAAIKQFTARMFNLLCLTGFISAGFMMADDTLNEEAIRRWLRAWSALVALTLALSPFEIELLLDSAIAMLLLVLLTWSWRAFANSSFVRVWQAGLLLSAISLPAAQFASGGAAIAISAFRVNVAFALCALSIAFWLRPRYSSIESESAEESLRLAAVLLCFGGGLISLGRLELPEFIGLSAAALIVLCYLILAGNLARSLRDRGEDASLAPHWIALATLFWLVGGGLLGALTIQDGVGRATGQTDVSAAQAWLGNWVIVSILLAFSNETATALRGDNRRVTGYVPLWLIAFGAGLSFIAQLCRGVAQFILREYAPDASVGELDLLLPITVVWIICLLAATAGIAAYTLGFYLRRPEIHVVER
ncbi:MAG: hypothetical protein OXG78_16450 [Chloroflexi bacterium]|nr:hypothetical protein [Chloroflexota bacterium]